MLTQRKQAAMATTSLDALIGIWERWTDGNPVLRHVVQSMDGAETDHCRLVEQVLRHLDWLLRTWTMGDMATSAAILAGWAVLLALEDMDGTMASMVRSTGRDAEEAHQYACAGSVPWKIG
jgi:hypothetical protein